MRELRCAIESCIGSIPQLTRVFWQNPTDVQLLGRAATTHKSRDLFYNLNECFGRTNPNGNIQCSSRMYDPSPATERRILAERTQFCEGGSAICFVTIIIITMGESYRAARSDAVRLGRSEPTTTIPYALLVLS